LNYVSVAKVTDPLYSEDNADNAVVRPVRPWHEIYSKKFGISQDRRATGSAIILLGMAFRDDGLDRFLTPREAMNALLGKKPAKSKKAA
jgi:hypothetical protein